MLNDLGESAEVRAVLVWRLRELGTLVTRIVIESQRKVKHFPLLLSSLITVDDPGSEQVQRSTSYISADTCPLYAFFILYIYCIET